MQDPSIFTDLYELTMAATYFAADRVTDQATFDLFVRRMPLQRNYMVFAGLPSVVNYIESLHFNEEAINYLRSLYLFSDDFLDYLKNFRFSGQLESLSEGELFFEGEPIIKVTAPLIEAQIIETSLINYIHLHSLLASKAARVVLAAHGKNVIDFGARRSHGQDAAVAAAYASYLVGADGTSNISAGKLLNIPVYGTMAHSFIQSFPTETEAFMAYLKQYPKYSTILIDTYEPLAAAHLISDIAHTQSLDIQAVRIDSGNLSVLTKQVRKTLDECGLQKTKIFLSGDLDEKVIADFERQKLPVDGFGIGTKMDVSADAPYLEMVYKLSHIEHGGEARHTMKASPEKKNLPGRKQIYRQYRKNYAIKDIIGLEDEELPGVPLLHPVIQNGKSIFHSTNWKSQRTAYRQRLSSFPQEMLSVDSTFHYPVKLSDGLQALMGKMSMLS